VVKNKLAPPFKEAQFDIIYGKGIVRERDLIHTGEKFGVIKKSGAWYSFNDTQLGQGLSNSAAFLAQNPDLANEIEREIRRRAGLLKEAEEPEAEEAKEATAPLVAKAKRGDARK
jgi:recombination protein RecA